jgi:hypothetical protein
MPKLLYFCLSAVVALAGCHSLGEWGIGSGCPLSSMESADSESDCPPVTGNCLPACRGCNPLGPRLRPFGNRYSNGADDFFSRYAATMQANEALRELRRETRQQFTAEFDDGFRQAYIDMATGGSGDVPVVPPRRYWNRHYRSAAGHGLVQEWFEGYRTAANEIHAVGTFESNTVAAATFQDTEDEYYAQRVPDRPTVEVSAPHPRVAAPQTGFAAPSHPADELLLVPSIELSPVPTAPEDAESPIETSDQAELPASGPSSQLSEMKSDSSGNESTDADGWSFETIRETVTLPSFKPTLPTMPAIKPNLPFVKMPTLQTKLPSVNVSAPPVPEVLKRMGAAIRGQ